MTLFEPEQLAPGVSVFSLSFLALFSALLLSRDRSSALILRLYASPLTGRDFILGYLLPMLPMALAQTLVCLLAAIPLGLPVSWRILACTAVNVPIALVNLALGMLCGTLLPEKAVGGMCGALLTNVSAWLSGIWFSLDLGGKVFAASPTRSRSPTPSTRRGPLWQGTGAACSHSSGSFWHGPLAC